MVDPSETIVQADPSVLAGLDHWRELPIKQQPVWPDAGAVAAASDEISTLPPLVFAPERKSARVTACFSAKLIPAGAIQLADTPPDIRTSTRSSVVAPSASVSARAAD